MTCGQGECGQLGAGGMANEALTPVIIPTVFAVVQVVAGGMHTLGGEVYTFSCNDEGALG